MANKTVTVKASGGDYTTLNAALAGEMAIIPNLVANTCILTIECYASAAPDTTPADTGNGWTTSASYYINIVVPEAERHSGKWDTAKYRLECTGEATALKLRAPYTRVTGVQAKVTTTGNGQIIYAFSNAGYNNGFFDKCIAWTVCSHTGGYTEGFVTTDSVTWRNCVAIGTGAQNASATRSRGFDLQAAVTATVNNCTAYGYQHNFYCNTGTFVAKNCISQASVTAGYSLSTSTGSDYNLSDRADAVGTTVYNSKTLTFVNAAAGDFHLVVGDTDAIDKGTDLSGTFTDDIDGVTRSGTWDLGADEYVAAGGSTRRICAGIVG